MLTLDDQNAQATVVVVERLGSDSGRPSHRQLQRAGHALSHVAPARTVSRATSDAAFEVTIV